MCFNISNCFIWQTVVQGRTDGRRYGAEENPVGIGPLVDHAPAVKQLHRPIKTQCNARLEGVEGGAYLTEMVRESASASKAGMAPSSNHGLATRVRRVSFVVFLRFPLLKHLHMCVCVCVRRAAREAQNQENEGETNAESVRGRMKPNAYIG